MIYKSGLSVVGCVWKIINNGNARFGNPSAVDLDDHETKDHIMTIMIGTVDRPFSRDLARVGKSSDLSVRGFQNRTHSLPSYRRLYNFPRTKRSPAQGLNAGSIVSAFPRGLPRTRTLEEPPERLNARCPPDRDTKIEHRCALMLAGFSCQGAGIIRIGCSRANA